MPRTDLSPYMSLEPNIIGYADTNYSNPFEEVVRRKAQKDFERFLIQNEEIQIKEKIKELEKEGKIKVCWNKINNTDMELWDGSARELPKTIKAFLVGVCTGIGLIMLLI